MREGGAPDCNGTQRRWAFSRVSSAFRACKNGATSDPARPSGPIVPTLMSRSSEAKVTSRSPLLDAAAAQRWAKVAMDRCDALAKHSEDSRYLFRRCLTPAMKDAHQTLGAWMRDAGLTVEVDAIGNLRGTLAAAEPDAPRLLVGSHLDTIRDAGKYDGPLGVVLGLTMLEALRELGLSLPYHVEVIGFSDEEGVRFGRPFLGSMALVGRLPKDDLGLTDPDGVPLGVAMARFHGGTAPPLAEAKVDPEDVLGYLEMHIEQGPVLESENLSVAVVEAIAGQHWETITFEGRAGHAGTTPMELRRDALAGAAELILGIERIAEDTEHLVATVGDVEARPGGNNVIAGEAIVEVDVRSPYAGELEKGLVDVSELAADIAAQRALSVSSELHFEHAPVAMDAGLKALLRGAVEDAGQPLYEMPSYAGHDARITAPRIPSAMLFLRSPGGLSHHPDERVHAKDVAVTLQVAVAFLMRLAARFERAPEIRSAR